MATVTFRLNKPFKRDESVKGKPVLRDKKGKPVPKDEPVSIQVCLYVSKFKRPEVATTLSIEPMYWYFKKGKAKTVTGAPLINQKLQVIETDLENLWLENKDVDREHLKRLMQEYFRGKDWNVKPDDYQKKSDPPLIKYIKEFTQKCEDGEIIRKGRTIKGYYGFLNNITTFAEETNVYLSFESITLAFYRKYMAWLYKRGNCDNTAGSRIKDLKMFMNAAFEEKKHINAEPKQRTFKKVSGESDSVYLSELEIYSIYKLDLSKEPRIEQYRDLFVFNCWIGIRYGDLCNIRSEQITQRLDGKYLRVTPGKTQNEVIVPFHPLAEAIYSKYDKKLPKITKSQNKSYNAAIRKVAARVGINSIEQKRIFTKGEAQERWLKKHEMVSAHSARRSFATNCYNLGIPTVTIMAITGHKSETIFLKYVRTTKDQHAAIMMKAFNNTIPPTTPGLQIVK